MMTLAYDTSLPTVNSIKTVAVLERMDVVVRELQVIERRTGLEKTFAVGELVLRHFFDENPQRWRERKRNKNHSIRRLAEQAGCPFRKSSLNDAVAIYVLAEELPCVRTPEHLNTLLGLFFLLYRSSPSALYF